MKIDQLPVGIFQTNEELGRFAAAEAAPVIQQAIRERGVANVILATGNSQLTFLQALRVKPIDWSKVNIFHMVEYLGLVPTHSASFPAFLRRHFLSDIMPKAFFPVVSHGRYPEDVCHEYAATLRAHPIDLTALGIGENGHLAFNDPPFTEFNDPAWVKVIRSAEASRRQQVGEGHCTRFNRPACDSVRKSLRIVPSDTSSNRASSGTRIPGCWRMISMRRC